MVRDIKYLFKTDPSDVDEGTADTIYLWDNITGQEAFGRSYGKEHDRDFENDPDTNEDDEKW